MLILVESIIYLLFIFTFFIFKLYKICLYNRYHKKINFKVYFKARTYPQFLDGVQLIKTEKKQQDHVGS